MKEQTLGGHQRTTLMLLFAAGLVNFLDRSSLSIASTTIQREMHLDSTQIGVLLTAFSLAYGFAQLPLIGLVDRLGTRPVLGVGLAIWSAAQMLSGVARGMPSLIALRLMLGAREAPFYPAGVRSVREWFSPGVRGRATAAMSMSQTLGLAIAPPILTGMILSIGWRRSFMLLGFIGLVIAVLWLVLQRSRSSTVYAEDHADLAISSLDALRTLLRQRTVWGMMLGFGGVNYTSWLYISWLPGYLQTERHLSLAKSGWVAALPFLCGALGMLASGTLADRLGRSGVALPLVHRINLVAGMMLSAGCTWFVAHSSTTFASVIGISGALFCIHFAGTSGWGYVQAISPQAYVASLTALQNFASFMIASAAPVLTGWLLDRTHSYSLALAVCSAITLLGALSYATLAAPDGMRMPLPLSTNLPTAVP